MMYYQHDPMNEMVAVEEHTATSDTAHPDKLFICPYDSLHRVKAARFPYHLIKCRKNYRGKDLIPCPFNARHLIPRPEQRHHLANCPDKVLIEKDHEYASRQSVLEDSNYMGNVSVPDYTTEYEIPEPTESWDDEVDNTRSFIYGREYEDNYQTYAPPQRLSSQIPLQYSNQPPESLRRPHAPAPPPGMGYHSTSHAGYQPHQNGYKPNMAPQPNLAGIGRGMTAVRPPAPGFGRGIGRGSSEASAPPPGFGRGRTQPRAPIAANIFNSQQSVDDSVKLEGHTPTHNNNQRLLGIGRGQAI